jgi:hypothetical protein
MSKSPRNYNAWHECTSTILSGKWNKETLKEINVIKRVYVDLKPPSSNWAIDHMDVMDSSIITSTWIQLIVLLYFVLLRQLKRAGGQSSSTASTSNATISTGRPSSIHKFGTVRLKSPCTNSLTYVPACVLRRKMKCPGWSSSKVTFISWTVRGLTAKGLLLN